MINVSYKFCQHLCNRQNAWLKFEARIVLAIRGFNRTWLSCQKKYKTILVEYKKDKRLHEILRAGSQPECK